ncbi:MAG: nuclear transport factor 2 family protein [Burkholderiaceae bacterium]|nr:nuclear transport factor 2 family protein [Burkholderiaceae bacterium]
MTTIEKRLQALEDQLEISQLRAKYCHYLDDFEWEKFVSLFTEDGEFQGLSTARGHKELMTFFSQVVPSMQEKFWHFCTNGTVEIDGDTATGRITMEFFSITNGKSFVSAGHYDDVMVRDEKGWKFKSRKITFYFYSPLEEGFTGRPPGAVQSVQQENS